MDLNRLKRFDKAKHDQLEQLVAWCQMMGLEGKDLVSIGGHLDRAKKSAEAKANRELAQSIKFDQVGADKVMNTKWSLKTNTGRYTFEDSSWQRVYVTSNKTRVRKSFDLEWYEIGRVSWRDRNRLQCALNIIHGEIKLDF
jgi:hypothetical protein